MGNETPWNRQHTQKTFPGLPLLSNEMIEGGSSSQFLDAPGHQCGSVLESCHETKRGKLTIVLMCAVDSLGNAY